MRHQCEHSGQRTGEVKPKPRNNTFKMRWQSKAKQLAQKQADKAKIKLNCRKVS